MSTASKVAIRDGVEYAAAEQLNQLAQSLG
jgi:hypothetical protein